MENSKSRNEESIDQDGDCMETVEDLNKRLWKACEVGDVEVVKYLVEKGADIHAVNNVRILMRIILAINLFD